MKTFKKPIIQGKKILDYLSKQSFGFILLFKNLDLDIFENKNVTQKMAL